MKGLPFVVGISPSIDTSKGAWGRGFLEIQRTIVDQFYIVLVTLLSHSAPAQEFLNAEFHKHISINIQLQTITLFEEYFL